MKAYFTTAILGVTLLSASALSLQAIAYDGTNCKAPGNCWEPKPGFPAKIAGTKYDNKLDPAEVAKQDASERQMEQRNAKRVDNFRKTGKFEYDVSKISEK